MWRFFANPSSSATLLLADKQQRVRDEALDIDDVAVRTKRYGVNRRVKRTDHLNGLVSLSVSADPMVL